MDPAQAEREALLKVQKVRCPQRVNIWHVYLLRVGIIMRHANGPLVVSAIDALSMHLPQERLQKRANLVVNILRKFIVEWNSAYLKELEAARAGKHSARCAITTPHIYIQLPLDVVSLWRSIV